MANFCSKCRTKIGREDRFCPSCGTEIGTQPPAQPSAQPSIIGHWQAKQIDTDEGGSSKKGTLSLSNWIKMAMLLFLRILLQNLWRV